MTIKLPFLPVLTITRRNIPPPEERLKFILGMLEEAWQSENRIRERYVAALRELDALRAGEDGE